MQSVWTLAGLGMAGRDHHGVLVGRSRARLRTGDLRSDPALCTRGSYRPCHGTQRPRRRASCRFATSTRTRYAPVTAIRNAR